MISRAFFTIGTGLKKAISTIVYFFVGDLTLFFQKDITKKINLMADASSSGVAIVRFGPKYYSKNLAVIRSKLPPEQVEAQLKSVMDASDEKARSPYAVFQWFTDSPFFLAMANKEAMPWRRQTMPLLNSAGLIQQAEKHHAKFLDNLRQGDLGHINNAVYIYIHNILLSQLFGTTEIPPEVTDLMLKIESNVSMFQAAVLPKFFALRPGPRKSRKEFQQISSIISEIIGDQDSLNEPFNRLKLAMLLASNNLSKILLLAIINLRQSRLLYNQLLYEINADSDSMPFLHAFYLEALRCAAPMNAVLRYTSKGISTRELTVPPNSLIIFDLEYLLYNSLYFNDPDKFLPSRFLGNEHSLNHGMLLPFGVGIRICPAVNITEKLFKWIIINTIKTIDPPQDSLGNLFLDVCRTWKMVPREEKDDPSYKTYVARENEQKEIDENNSIQFILNANIMFEENHEPQINIGKLLNIVYQAATYPFFALTPYRITWVNAPHHMSAINEAKKSYNDNDGTTLQFSKTQSASTMSYHWNILMDRQVIIYCRFKQDDQLNINDQAKTTADSLNAISDGIFTSVGCMPFLNNYKKRKLNGYFSYKKPRHTNHLRFFQLVQSYMKPYDRSAGAVDYPKLTVDKNFVLSTPAPALSQRTTLNRKT